MDSRSAPVIDSVTPDQAYDAIQANPSQPLVDVRTRAEWSFVGVPDLSAADGRLIVVEWTTFPEMRGNPSFFDELDRQFGSTSPERIFFLCRSGVRSLHAAEAVAEHYAKQNRIVHCTNVAEGFEGDLDENGHRGRVNGWKARRLPWRQS